MRRTQARSMVSFLITKFMKSDVRRTQARDHFFAFSLFSHWTSAKSRNRHSHALRRSLFFLAAVQVPVHILGFCNTSQLRIVFSEVKTWKVLTPFAFFTSGTKIATIIFASSNSNEKPCIILTVLSRSRFSKLRRAKPTWEQHFFAVSRFCHHQNCDSRSGILIRWQNWHPHARRGAQKKVRPAAVGMRIPTF